MHHEGLGAVAHVVLNAPDVNALIGVPRTSGDAQCFGCSPRHIVQRNLSLGTVAHDQRQVHAGGGLAAQLHREGRHRAGFRNGAADCADAHSCGVVIAVAEMHITRLAVRVVPGTRLAGKLDRISAVAIRNVVVHALHRHSLRVGP